MSTIIKDRVEEIQSLLLAGLESWQKAGKIIATLVDEMPDAIDKICQECPQLTPSILRTLERVGRGTIQPELLLRSGAGYTALRDQPPEIQAKYLKDPVPIVIMTREGPDTLNVNIADLTSKQAKQVFSPDGVRSVSGQRAWLASNGPVAPQKEEIETLPYSVHGRTVVFYRGCKMNRGELLALAEQIK